MEWLLTSSKERYEWFDHTLHTCNRMNRHWAPTVSTRSSWFVTGDASLRQDLENLAHWTQSTTYYFTNMSGVFMLIHSVLHFAVTSFQIANEGSIHPIGLRFPVAPWCRLYNFLFFRNQHIYYLMSILDDESDRGYPCWHKSNYTIHAFWILINPTCCWKVFKQVMAEANTSQNFYITIHTEQHGRIIRPCVCILYFIQEIQA